MDGRAHLSAPADCTGQGYPCHRACCKSGGGAEEDIACVASWDPSLEVKRGNIGCADQQAGEQRMHVILKLVWDLYFLLYFDKPLL